MRVSQKTEYALRAMLELARQSQRAGPTRTAEIAKSQRIPEKFLETILVELRRAGLIATQRGPIGGHRLTREAERISVGEIWRAIEGSNSRKNGNGQRKSVADPFGSVWEQVDRAIDEVVDGMTLDEIRARSDTRPLVPDFSI